MSRFSLEVVEHQGHRERTAIRADDYEELVEKVAAKTGIEVQPDTETETPETELLADGGAE